eukprot:scaffold1104_cov299-Prasinococcus_capsulatus_cf.AAC.14
MHAHSLPPCPSPPACPAWRRASASGRAMPRPSRPLGRAPPRGSGEGFARGNGGEACFKMAPGLWRIGGSRVGVRARSPRRDPPEPIPMAPFKRPANGSCRALIGPIPIETRPTSPGAPLARPTRACARAPRQGEHLLGGRLRGSPIRRGLPHEQSCMPTLPNPSRRRILNRAHVSTY